MGMGEMIGIGSRVFRMAQKRFSSGRWIKYKVRVKTGNYKELERCGEIC